MLDNLALAISRLTDNARTAGKDNLSIPALIDAVQLEDTELASNLERIYAKLEQSVEKFRNHRHKRIAHNDLDIATKKSALEPYALGDIATCLDQLAEILNAYEYATSGKSTAYSHTMLPFGSDGEALIRALQESDQLKEVQINDLLAEAGGLGSAGDA